MLVLAVFLGWRFVRPMNIFMVTDAFERPLSTTEIPVPFRTLRAEECAACHSAIYAEWRTSIHSQAWTDPYFQVDWEFDRNQQICKNCHIPLDRQQEHLVLGFRDKEKWKPVLEPNPDFDPLLQQEGVTCTACHLHEGNIIGVHGDTPAPHPVKVMDYPDQLCVRCHVVEGDRWDTFFRLPPCGTVAEIQSIKQSGGLNDKAAVQNIPELGCVQCHMPLVERPAADGSGIRKIRQHIWRGGHDPEMVKSGLKVLFEETRDQIPDMRTFTLTLTNVGAAHYLPTGTPDRYLSVHLRLLDTNGEVVKEQAHTLKRTIIWRPFIVDLWDTRLPRWQPRMYAIESPVSNKGQARPAVVEAVVRYHLLDEKRRKRIGYENKEPIAYEVFRQQLPLEDI
ncbi:MAG: cytochrome c family protein [Gammaproteobacteria bacterium]|nr:cytochrome c family protein [Gammaproteobacteria bacterium]